jgi:thiamine pyrophosphokinase
MSPKAAALILLDGEIPEPGLVRAAARRSRAVICADGGLRHAVKLRLKADFVAGDMDSLPHPLPPRGKTIYMCDFDENRSDFEKSLDVAGALGCRRVYLAGILGGRVDHALVNLGVAERCAGAFDVIVLDRGAGRLLGPGTHRLGFSRGRFSLLASPRAVVSLSGARYPLSRFALVPGSRGLGNAARGEPVLTIHEGRAWLLCDRQPASW